MPQTSTAPLTDNLAQQFAESHFPGFCVAVVDHDHTTYLRGFGYADVNHKTPYTVETVQPVGSVSKTLIGIALMKAVELGFFSLDADINKLLDFKVSNPYFPNQQITPRQLATHTSGIIDREEVYQKTYLFGRNTPATSLDAFLRSYLTKRGKFYSRRNFDRHRPGKAFNYSNIGATLAAYLIEVRSGMPFAKFTDKYVLQPLGMQNSGWFDASEHTGQAAVLYNPQMTPYPVYASNTYPDGSLRSSCADLSKYLIGIIRGYRGDGTGLLEPDSFWKMLSPQFSAKDKISGVPERDPNQGIFFDFRRDGSIGHTGSDYGVSAFMFFNPQTNVGKIFLTNIDIQENPKLATEFAQIWKMLDDWKSEGTLK